MLINTTSSPAPFSSPQGSLAEAAANHHSLVQGMFYEECDINDDDATFYIFAATTTPEPQRVGYNPLSPCPLVNIIDWKMLQYLALLHCVFNRTPLTVS